MSTTRLGMCIEILPSFFTSHLSTSNLKLNYKRILCIVSKCIFFNKVSLTSFCMIAQNLLEISENRLPGAILKAFHIESYDINNAVKSLLLEISCMKQRREIMFTKKTNPTHPTHLLSQKCVLLSFNHFPRANIFLNVVVTLRELSHKLSSLCKNVISI